MKRKKIIFDANPLVLWKSGIGYYTQGLMQAMADAEPDTCDIKGHYFNFLGRKHPVNLPSAPNLRYIQSRLVPGKVLSICRKLGFQPFFEFFTKQTADIAIYPNYVALPSITKCKKVVMVHDLSFIDCPEYVSEKNRAFLHKWVPGSIEQADLVVTISSFTKERIMQTFSVSGNKIYITPIPPVAQAEPDTAIIQKHSIENGYILFMGTIEPRKNIAGLLEAYTLLPASMKDKFPLVLAGGKGWNDENILKRIEQLQSNGLKIVQTGYVTDSERSALYQKATLFVLPSYYEGFGMPVLEAMKHGKPVACSDIPVLHEVAGDSAVYFDQNNPQSIAETLSVILDSAEQIKEYSRKATEHVKDFPTWHDVAVGLYDAINKL